MPRGDITLKWVKAARPAPRSYEIWDNEVGGFVLRVNPGGSKTYYMRYQLHGRASKEQFYKIGSFPSIAPQDARTEAKRLKHLIDCKVDILAERHRRRDEANTLAFDALLPTFVDTHLKARWKAWTLPDGLLRRYAAPKFAGRSVRDIERADITLLMDGLNHIPGARRNLFRALSVFFGYCVDRGFLAISPMLGMKAPPPVASGDRTLAEEEIAHFWEATDQMAYPFGDWMQLLLLTSTRRTECAALKWDELDRERAVWKLPAARAKNKLLTDIPLNDAALEVLDRVAAAQGQERAGAGRPIRWPRNGYVFTTTADTPISGYSKAKRRLDELMLESMRKAADQAGEDPHGCFLAPWSYHDLRRTVATYAAKLEVPLEVAEAMLNHASGSRAGLRAVYNLHDYAPEKRAALQQLGKFLTGLRRIGQPEQWLQAAE